jgi:hypothetical protein
MNTCLSDPRGAQWDLDQGFLLAILDSQYIFASFKAVVTI